MKTQTNTRTPPAEGRTSARRKTKAQGSNDSDVTARTAGSTSPSYDDIAARAYAIWNAQGRPQGRENEHWQQAEEELMAQSASSSSAA